MFENARYAVLTKTDLLPHVPFDVERAMAMVRQVNPALECFQLSALTGAGMDRWFEFLRNAARPAPAS